MSNHSVRRGNRGEDVAEKWSETTASLIASLEEAGAQHLPSQESLNREHWRMLGSFGRAGLKKEKWKHLEACGPHPCRHATCSAACHWGERLRILTLVEQAYDLLKSQAEPVWWVTIVDPRHRRSLGALGTLSINGFHQSLRRKFARLEWECGAVRAIGAIEASVEVQESGLRYWGPHLHVPVSGDCSKEQILRCLRPAGRLPNGFRPVEAVPITNLANALSYAMKRNPARRTEYVGSRSTKDRWKVPATGVERLEYDQWLLGQKSTDRLFLHGLKRVHDRLVLISK